MNQSNNIVIGGGIAGLCIAYHLVKRGETVTLIESEHCGAIASSKAAGMITPASEAHLGQTRLMECFLQATAYYEEFVSALTNNQPQKIDYRKMGSLLCAINHDGISELTRLYKFQKEMGLDVEEIDKARLAELEPLLMPRVTHAVFAKNEACVDNNKLVAALREGLLHSGHCEIIENQSVDMVLKGDCIEAVMIGREKTRLSAKNYFLATGLSHNIPTLTETVKLPLRGVKGQVLTLASLPGVLSRPVRIHHRYPVYLVPRADGRIVIGATSEEQSDTNVTAGGMMDLLGAAWQVLPQIYDAPIVEFTAGLRPATPDHKPLFGVTPLQNLFLLTGLYRHGIMAAPLLARDLVDFVLTGKNRWKEFGLNRFFLTKL